MKSIPNFHHRSGGEGTPAIPNCCRSSPTPQSKKDQRQAGIGLLDEVKARRNASIIKSVSKLGGKEVTQTMMVGGPSHEQKLQKPAATTRRLGGFLQRVNRSDEAREALEKETPGSRRGRGATAKKNLSVMVITTPCSTN